ncbi:Fibroblast growth factor receptor homolog 1 [Gryllus bimaculatus]|nr:Fibroblast growth factor receptor homolog 1 [Gryllus bimaculatus]
MSESKTRMGKEYFEDISNWLVMKSLKRSDSGHYACLFALPSGDVWNNFTLVVERTCATSVEDGVDERTHPESSLSPLHTSQELATDGRKNSAASVQTEKENFNTFSKPEFSKHFDSRVVKSVGNVIRLKCPAIGHPSLNITWLFNGKKVEKPSVKYGRWSLEIEDAMVPDTGNYTCVVCNELGCINFTYRVDVFGPLTAQSEEVLHRPPGSKFLESCQASAIAPSNHPSRWYYNGVELLHQPPRVVLNGQKLQLTHLLSTDSGHYACLLALPSGDRWRNFTLAVEGQASTLERGSGDEQSLRGVEENDNLMGAEVDFPHIQDSNENELPGSYDQKTVQRGGQTILHCPEDDGNVTWVKLNTHVNVNTALETNIDRFQVIVPDNGTGDLILDDVVIEDSGWYSCITCNPQCKIRNAIFLQVTEVIWPPESQHMADTEDSHDSEGDSDKDISVSVQAGQFNDSGVARAPEFTKKFNKLIAKPAGNMIRLKCPAIGNPSPNITWLFDGAKHERKFGEYKYGRWSLLLEDLVTSDSGNYTCVVCNEFGCINFTFTVAVVERLPHKPYMTEGYPLNQTVELNSTATFECKILSDEEPYIQWVKTGYTPIVVDENDTVINGTVVKQSGVDNPTPEILRLHNVTYEDEGWYT